jgi:hypothetical protein
MASCYSGPTGALPGRRLDAKFSRSGAVRPPLDRRTVTERVKVSTASVILAFMKSEKVIGQRHLTVAQIMSYIPTQVERFFGVHPEVASLNQVYESLFMQREWIGDGWRQIT